VALLCAPTIASAQKGFPRAEVTVMGGALFRIPDAFQDCGSIGSAATLSTRAGWHATPRWTFEATVDFYAQIPFGVVCAVDANFTPIPPTGPFTTRQSSYPDFASREMPPLHAGVRVGYVPFRRGAFEWRLNGSVEHAVDAAMWLPAAGTSAVLGEGRFRVVMEADVARYSIVKRQQTIDYLDGRVVKISNDDHDDVTLSPRIRFGMMILLPRRR
jgi:hypothetical protein